MSAPIRRLFVAGAGHMGHGIAQVSAAAGLEVTLFDVNAVAVAAAMDKVRWSLGKLHEKGKLAEPPAAVLGRLATTTELGAAAAADMVIEAVPERADVKLALFARLDAVCPAPVIFVSNTSAIPITRLAAGTARPDRFCGAHFFGPVQIMTLVEVTRGAQTSDPTAEAVLAFVREIGKEPVLLAHDIAGFIVNRVLMAATCQAARLVESGVAPAAEVDRAMRLGLNWKMGPLELSDFSGLDVVLGCIQAIYDDAHDPAFLPPKMLEQLVAAGRRAKNGQRLL